MRCKASGCRKTKNVNTSTQLCPSCEESFLVQSNKIQPSNSTANSVPSSPHVGPPQIDLDALKTSYSSMLAANDCDQPKILLDMFGMLLCIFEKQKEIEDTLEQVRSNTVRIEELETKLAQPIEVAETIGICIKNLPLPTHGVSELENVRTTLANINAPNVDLKKDITKAVRVGSKEGYVGTVRVEFGNDKARVSVMKNKKVLNNSDSPVLKSLVIKNWKSHDQLKLDNFAKDVIRMLPNGNALFLGGNGRIRQKGGLG